MIKQQLESESSRRLHSKKNFSEEKKKITSQKFPPDETIDKFLRSSVILNVLNNYTGVTHLTCETLQLCRL